MTKVEASHMLPPRIVPRWQPRWEEARAAASGSGLRRTAYSFQGELAARQPVVAIPPPRG